MSRTHLAAAWCVRVFLACAAIGWAASGGAQTFYKWTDDHGVVHLSDSPPPRAQNVEERSLNVAPVVNQPGTAADDLGTASAAAAGRPDQAGAAGSAPKGGEGPAKVVVVARNTPRTGPSTMHVSGEVKNVGGEPAKSVAVTVTAVDSTQGTSCLEDEAPVHPESLGPGEKGNFDINLDSPCLYGDTNVDLQAVWE
jgi:hypothetical protein